MLNNIIQSLSGEGNRTTNQDNFVDNKSTTTSEEGVVGVQSNNMPDNGTEQNLSKQSDTSQQLSKSDLPMKRLEEMEPAELINELKKWQRIAEERKVAIEKSRSVPNEFQEFINKAKSDFWGAYKEYQDKLGLPHYEFVQSQAKLGDIESQMEAYQNNVLVPEIMEKFGLEEFEFDPSEAWIPKTPSFYFREKMEEYNRQLKSKYENEVRQAQELMQKIEEQKSKDIEFLKKAYFSDNEEEFNKLFDEFNHPPDISVLTNPENHILSLKNIFRGYYFDKLVERIVKQEVDKVHAQYAKLGIKLPKSDMPVDASSVKSSGVPMQDEYDSTAKISPLRRTISRQLS